MKKKYGQTVLIIGLMLLLVCMLCGCSGKSEKTTEEPEETSETTVVQPSSFDDRCLDELGQPTLYAVTELTGPEIAALLEEQGYEWERKDDVLKGFYKRVYLPGETVGQTVEFTAENEIVADSWEREDYDKNTEKGAACKMFCSFEVAGYKDPEDEDGTKIEDAIKAIANIDIVDQCSREDLDIINLIVKDSAGKEYLVCVQDVGPARLSIFMYSEDVFEKNGSSIEEEWAAVNGQ